MSASNCLFCTLSTNNPNILYQNDSCYVLLDINPLSKGHLLVIPKKHSAYLHEYGNDDLVEILPTIQKIVKCLGLEKYNILQNNGNIQEIFHAHFHVIPVDEEKNKLEIVHNKIDLPEKYVENTVKDLQEKLAKI